MADSHDAKGMPASLEGALRELLSLREESERLERVRSLKSEFPEHAEVIDVWLYQYSLSDQGLVSDQSPADGDGRSIGAYVLQRRVGRGGFGEVWLAEQREPVVRQVAVKLLRVGMDIGAVVKRFEQEKQILAALNHESVAKIFDGGVTSEGRPYFVMEYVAGGTPITEFCDEHRLSIPERIKLFQLVCAGVQHSHQMGILHRDLKPSNILVTKVGGRFVPKIIDFGIAKDTAKSGDAATVYTAEQQVIGTPEYMPPEQAAGEPVLSTAVDVYSLGVVLYELLCGQLPFPSTELRGRSNEEVLRVLRDQEPKKPSSRIHASAVDSAAEGSDSRVQAGCRRLRSAAAWGGVIRGDLDWIALMALRKEPERRYGAAADFAEDLRRYLDHEPVRARAPSFGYRARKFVRRYRVQVAAVLLVTGSLIAGGIATYSQYRRAENNATVASNRAEENGRLAQANAELATKESDARKKAEGAAEAASQAARREAARSRELATVAGFQKSQLSEVNAELMGTRLRQAILAGAPEQRREELEKQLAGVNFTSIALEVLWKNIFDRGLKAISRDFGDQPLVRASLLQAVASTLYGVGLFSKAVGPQEEALRIRRAELGEDDIATLASAGQLGTLLRVRGELRKAEPLLKSVVEARERLLGEDHRHAVNAMHNLAEVYRDQGRHEDAEKFYRRAIKVGGERFPRETLVSQGSLAGLLVEMGRVSDAEALYSETLDGIDERYGREDYFSLGIRNNVAFLLQRQGKHKDALLLQKEVLGRARDLFGAEHPNTLVAENNVGNALFNLGRVKDAEPYFMRSYEGRMRVLGAQHAATATAANQMGSLLKRLGDVERAEMFFRKALDGARKSRGPDHPDTLQFMSNLAVCLEQQGKLDDAEPLMREAIKRYKRRGDQSYLLVITIGNLGRLLHARKDLDGAEREYKNAFDTSSSKLGESHMLHAIAAMRLGALLLERGQAKRTVQLLEPLEPAARKNLAQLQGGKPLGSFQRTLGQALAAGSNPEALTRAAKYLSDAFEAIKLAAGPNDPEVRECAESLARLHRRLAGFVPSGNHAGEAKTWADVVRQIDAGSAGK